MRTHFFSALLSAQVPTVRALALTLAALVCHSSIATAQTEHEPILDKRKQLDYQTFWDNRDWDWYAENIPFFECPDADITTTYYYRWELLTKHLTYGSPNTGYVFTEFIDRPFWSGAYGAISCPAGHQLYEARWLRQPRVARDYLRYYFRTQGAQPRNYSTWLADSAWALNLVHPDRDFIVDLLPDFVKNYEGWEARHFVPEVGLFWQTGHDDGMEFNINSRQTKDILRGAPSYRPSFNAYIWADAIAIAKIAKLAGEKELATKFEDKAAKLKSKMQELLWDSKRQFFFPAYRDNEEADGHRVTALSRTYESGKFAGDAHGRELIGYVPWQFNMLDNDKGFEVAWDKLMQRDAFMADFGPTTVERNDPMFLLKDSCCWWSGQSWPYATTQTLKALANVLRTERPENSKLPVTARDYVELLEIFAKSHRKDGRPYLAEALHPDTGSFKGHDGYNHSEHYFHSSFCDLVITGLVGVQEQPGELLVIDPLAPATWDYFALDDLPYHGRRVGVVWDRDGDRYSFGPGLHVIIDGQQVATSRELQRTIVPFADAEPSATATKEAEQVRINYAVNNDGDYFPRVSASYVAPGTSLAKLNDGNYWYHKDPPNRWTSVGSSNAEDWIEFDLGAKRKLDTLKLYFLDDIEQVVAPKSCKVEIWDGNDWQPLGYDDRSLREILGHRATTITFDESEIERFRITLTHAPEGRSGLTEVEAWGSGTLPHIPAPPPAGNLAFNSGSNEFPKATASYSDRFGGKPMSAIDGKIIYLPTPMNRWTSYESPNAVDWLDIDFGKDLAIGRVELHVYDDRGGVQAPTEIKLQSFEAGQWKDIAEQQATPVRPVGGTLNTIRFPKLTTPKLRILFTNKDKARSGVTEVEVWEK
ncbi:MAG: discoidin domain-containing protein [Pirellulaceae bacterium]|nr:discoidin domain-containing protein [Pirellulaceae bacterium]